MTTTTYVTVPVSVLARRAGSPGAVEQAFARLPGVVRVQMYPATDVVEIEYDPTSANAASIAIATYSIGLDLNMRARVSTQLRMLPSNLDDGRFTHL